MTRKSLTTWIIPVIEYKALSCAFPGIFTNAINYLAGIYLKVFLYHFRDYLNS